MQTNNKEMKKWLNDPMKYKIEIEYFNAIQGCYDEVDEDYGKEFRESKKKKTKILHSVAAGLMTVVASLFYFKRKQAKDK